jgi:ubiquinol-cytochrome c reductase iron-sulfur subunit
MPAASDRAGPLTKGITSNVADSLAHPAAAADGVADPERRDFIHFVAAAATVGGAVAVAWPLIDQMNPAADTLALASLEYDLSKVALGQEVTIAWRKQPVFIRHRTPKEIAEARADDHAEMKDPATDASRVKPGHEQWLVVLASCTHLGCVPTFAQAITAAGCAPATARSTTPPAASGRARRR